ncbi:MAG: hypothetical protein AB8A46_06290 [Prochlorococcus sp.]|jgi:hypothetical protein
MVTTWTTNNDPMTTAKDNTPCSAQLVISQQGLIIAQRWLA